MLIRKTLAVVALSAAGFATAGMGTAFADDVHASGYVKTYDTVEDCQFTGKYYKKYGGWNGYYCLPTEDGRSSLYAVL